MGTSTSNRFSADFPSQNTLPARPYLTQPWHDDYMAALFEADKRRIGDRIKRAELTILAREQELYSGSGDPREQNALNNALHALRALRICMGL